MSAAGDPLAARLDALLERAVARRRHVHHGLATVAAIDGSWRWTAAHGALDPAGRPATPDARYPIASVSKLVTATVVLRLVEQERLALTDRLLDVVDDPAIRGMHVLDGIDRTHQITIEHLLSHTSGLPDYYEEAPAGGQCAQARLLAGQDAPMPYDEVVRLVRDELTPHFAPRPSAAHRRKARYADTNFQLLGAVVIAVTGQPLHTVFDEMVFAPLHLDDTSVYPHTPRSGAAPRPDTSVWAKDVVLVPDGALRHQSPDGGIISTLDDQLTFLSALVGGGVFTDPATWARMHARTNRIFFPVEYGLGVMRYAPARWMSPLRAIPAVVGHTGSTATWLWHCPELGVLTAGTFDTAQPPLPFRFVPRLLDAVGRSRAAV